MDNRGHHKTVTYKHLTKETQIIRRIKRRLGSIPVFPILAIIYVGACAGAYFWLKHLILVDGNPNTRSTFADLYLKACGALALAFGSYFTWRTLQNSQRTLRLSQEGQLTSRFSSAIDQLGAMSPSQPQQKAIEIRLGAIFALERIAWESERDYWPIMEVLTAYLRKNCPAESLETCYTKCQSDPVQPADLDVQAIISVIGRRRNLEYEDENDLKLDLKRIDLSNVDFSHTVLRGAMFDGSLLCNANLADVDLRNANIGRVCLRGAALVDHAKIGGVNFLDAITDGIILNADIEEDENTVLSPLMESRLRELRLERE